MLPFSLLIVGPGTRVIVSNQEGVTKRWFRGILRWQWHQWKQSGRVGRGHLEAGEVAWSPELWDWSITAECLPEKYVRRAKKCLFLISHGYQEAQWQLWEEKRCVGNANFHFQQLMPWWSRIGGAMGSHSVQDSQLGSATHPPNAIVWVTVGVFGVSVEQGRYLPRGSHVRSNWHSICTTSSRGASTPKWVCN